MKNLTLLSLSFLLNIGFGYGQGCFPDASYAQEDFGLYPEGEFNMDCGGLSSSKTFVGFVDTLLYFGIDPGNLTSVVTSFDAIKLAQVDGLPNGVTVVTDVANSATPESPYGTWFYSGVFPSLEASLGCVSLEASASDWLAASTGGAQGDGVFELTFYFDARIANTEPDLSTILVNGSFLSAAPTNFGGGVFLVTLSLDVNESTCVGTLQVSPQVVSDNLATQACDGQAYINVFNGVSPFTFELSNGSTSQTTASLCPGIYSVQVEDANGFSNVAQFGVASSDNVYQETGTLIPANTDTLYAYYSTCSLNYNIPIDSFYIQSVETYGLEDTMHVTWVVFQEGEPFTLEDFFIYDSNLDPTNVLYIQTLYCLNGRSEAGVIQLIQYWDGYVGVEDNQGLVSFGVKPNPSTGIFQLQCKDEAALLQVLDVKGSLLLARQLKGSTDYQFDLTDLPDGLYVVRLQTETGVGFKRIVKQ